MVKNLPANAGDTRDKVLIPGTEISPGVGNGNHYSILAWKIPWTEEPGGLQSTGSQIVGQIHQSFLLCLIRLFLSHLRIIEYLKVIRN